MTETFHYFSIQKPSTAEFKDRGSKFVAYAYPIENADDFKKFLQQVKKEHPKASHHCFAYRIGYDGINYRSSDDGEPAGSAGKPILGQIDSNGLSNVMIVVVRYFGGTLLGVPGLINAYKTAASLALQITPVIKKNIEVAFELHFDYTLLNEVMLIIKQLKCTVISLEQLLFCNMKIGVPKSNLQDFKNKLRDFHGLELKQTIQ